MIKNRMLWLIMASLLLWVSCRKAAPHKVISTEKQWIAGDSLRVIDEKECVRLTQIPNDSSYLFYYWASFSQDASDQLLQLNKGFDSLKEQGIHVYTINTDYPSSYEFALEPFLKENAIQMPILLKDSRKRFVFGNKLIWDGFVPFYILATEDSITSLPKVKSMQQIIEVFDDID